MWAHLVAGPAEGLRLRPPRTRSEGVTSCPASRMRNPLWVEFRAAPCVRVCRDLETDVTGPPGPARACGLGAARVAPDYLTGRSLVAGAHS